MNTDAMSAMHRSRQDDRVTNAPITPRIVAGTILLWLWRMILFVVVLNLIVNLLLAMYG